jgi:hypothetical protein
MPDTPLYPEDYDRDYYIEYLLRLTEGSPTDTHLEQALELVQGAVYPWADVAQGLELLQEHRTEWQDYFHAKQQLRERLLKLFGGLPLN